MVGGAPGGCYLTQMTIPGCAARLGSIFSPSAVSMNPFLELSFGLSVGHFFFQIVLKMPNKAQLRKHYCRLYKITIIMLTPNFTKFALLKTGKLSNLIFHALHEGQKNKPT